MRDSEEKNNTGKPFGITFYKGDNSLKFIN